MSENIIVELRERNIVIPKALPETINQMQNLISLRNDLIRESEKVAERYNPDDIYATPMCCYTKMYDIVDHYVQIYDQKLQNKYGSSARFFSFPKYLSDYYEISKSAENQLSNAYMRQAKQREYGMQLAESEAMKEIKGMSFGIITNKISSALIYAGISAATYSAQTQKAEQAYNRIMSNYASNRAENLEISIMSKEIVPLIYPVAEKTTAIFLRDVLDTMDLNSDLGYKELSEKHKTHVLANYENYIFGDTLALREAINRLEKINDVTNIHTELLDILEACPYCPEVYFKFFDLGMLNKTILSLAKLMHINTVVNQYIKSNADGIKHQYATLKKLCTNSKELSYWIKNHIGSDKNKLIALTQDFINSKIKSWLDEIFDEKQCEQLLNLELITINDIILNGNTSSIIQDIKDAYTSKLVSLVMNYIEQIKAKKSIYEDAYNIFNAGIEQRETLIAEKREQLRGLSLFAFSTKKVLKAEIANLESEYANYLKTEPIELKNAYFDM